MKHNQDSPQALAEEMLQKEATLREFNSLRPNNKQRFYRSAGMLTAVVFLVYCYPEIIEQPVLYILLILMMSLNAQAYVQNKRTNKRIDLLHKLLKDE
ncbi:hypothetical protein [Pseudoalteromonas peptidolytica]|uniref:Uncharacterized protein n=1 Tax=Pseudoalteromonas peptidolytica F12-50-A1 TaxID=1315280 RepID=A0A8I0MVB0_9GAMM|nr:hypothetical protein [Pseudoalteromonas peptidolytica]MBE0346461.1 hypothetical protein [Pseudoalteromonas peptidolytica F12-50-A1]NLR14598.1 hypothetical protein [Pseudoalteromonas peptidolytica]GEK10446.1 hypothetical protein PPE03_26950 [Pseudoalteromonas peptidolytica]